MLLLFEPITWGHLLWLWLNISHYQNMISFSEHSTTRILSMCQALVKWPQPLSPFALREATRSLYERVWLWGVRMRCVYNTIQSKYIQKQCYVKHKEKFYFNVIKNFKIGKRLEILYMVVVMCVQCVWWGGDYYTDLAAARLASSATLTRGATRATLKNTLSGRLRVGTERVGTERERERARAKGAINGETSVAMV